VLYRITRVFPTIRLLRFCWISTAPPGSASGCLFRSGLVPAVECPYSLPQHRGRWCPGYRAGHQKRQIKSAVATEITPLSLLFEVYIPLSATVIGCLAAEIEGKSPPTVPSTQDQIIPLAMSSPVTAKSNDTWEKVPPIVDAV
jgi:hypothetical protein